MKKILVIQLKQIGDVLLSSPICNTLKKNYPDSQIDYIVYDYTAGVVENNPNIDNIIKISSKERENKLEFIKLLMKLPKYDICINIQGKIEGLLITLFSRAKMKISWNKKGWRILHTHPVDTDKQMKITGAGNTIDGRLALLSPLGNFDYDRDLKIWIKDEERKNIKKIMESAGINLEKPIISFGVTSRREFRIWPKDRFAKLIDFLYEKYGIQAILFYAPNDKKYNSEEEHCNSVKELVQNKEAVFTNIKTKSARELIILLAESDMYIGNDNGPRHFAQAVDTPSFAIFTTLNNKKSFCPHDNPRHKAVDVQDVLEMSDDQYLEYMKKDEEYIRNTNDIPYDFVEKFIDNMVENLGIFKNK
ncbi:MAG: glycosyltransferase family 9 protein [Leptotrichiaceae bacterium]|nr:glycosyltransferase family 9 protein [Leptotrichiaceae bacterium]